MGIAAGLDDGDRPDPTGPPQELAPGDTGLSFLIARSALAEVRLDRLLAYPTGIAITVAYSIKEPAAEPIGYPDVTFEYPSGLKVSTDELMAEGWIESERLAASELGGGDVPSAGEWEYWISPLPAPGKLLLACRWTGADIEDVVQVDTAIIRAAAERSDPA